jgi:membrane associated rhomboid family serine protease
MLDQFKTKTCPKCDALITPQLDYCRQCNTYLHGTAFEGWIFKNLLGGYMSGAPGTALICVMILLFYALMTVLAGVDSFLGFTSFSLQQLGATHGPSILRGQYWRFMTSIFGHHDVLHLGMNIWCLVTVGPLVEKIFDRKKMLILYLVSGTLSMGASHIWYVLILSGPDTAIVSAGASGSVCGMIGAAWLGARRLGPQGKEIAGGMKRWAILMLVWGIFVPGINNAAHMGGFAVGAALAQFIPTGLTQTVGSQKIMSFSVLGLLACFGLCCGLMLENLRGYPASFEDDMESRAVFGQVYAGGVKPKFSAQAKILRECQEFLTKPSSDEAYQMCELNVRLNARMPASYGFLAHVQENRGNTQAAKTLQEIALRMAGRR